MRYLPFYPSKLFVHGSEGVIIVLEGIAMSCKQSRWRVARQHHLRCVPSSAIVRWAAAACSACVNRGDDSIARSRNREIAKSRAPLKQPHHTYSTCSPVTLLERTVPLPDLRWQPPPKVYESSFSPSHSCSCKAHTFDESA